VQFLIYKATLQETFKATLQETFKATLQETFKAAGDFEIENFCFRILKQNGTF